MKEMVLNETQEACFLWVDRKKHIVSFYMLDGFEKIVFNSRNNMLIYALDLALAGYRIQ